MTTHDDNKPVYKGDPEGRYAATAGECGYCGHTKTWQLRVQNPRTGKFMPAHIDGAGRRLGTGECPHFVDRDSASFREQSTTEGRRGGLTLPPPPIAGVQGIDAALLTTAITTGLADIRAEIRRIANALERNALAAAVDAVEEDDEIVGGDDDE